LRILAPQLRHDLLVLPAPLPQPLDLRPRRAELRLQILDADGAQEAVGYRCERRGAAGLDAAAGGEVEGDPPEELFHVGDGVEGDRLAEDRRAAELLAAGALLATLLLLGGMPGKGDAVTGAPSPKNRA
jgi:hypothetical protein